MQQGEASGKFSDCLVVDAGNSALKARWITDGRVRQTWVLDNGNEPALQAFFKERPDCRTLVCTSRGNEPELRDWFFRSEDYFFDHLWVPEIRLAYARPETLGRDRLAAMSGARARFPQTPLCVADAGTCLTADFLDPEGQHLGGIISPGLQMRFHSMHRMTGSLPLVEQAADTDLLGNSTPGCMRSGAQGGLVRELEGLFEEACRKYQMPFRLILTGGDANFLADRLKTANFVAPNLVLDGLYHALQTRFAS